MCVVLKLESRSTCTLMLGIQCLSSQFGFVPMRPCSNNRFRLHLMPHLIVTVTACLTSNDMGPLCTSSFKAKQSVRPVMN